MRWTLSSRKSNKASGWVPSQGPVSGSQQGFHSDWFQRPISAAVMGTRLFISGHPGIFLPHPCSPQRALHLPSQLLCGVSMVPEMGNVGHHQKCLLYPKPQIAGAPFPSFSSSWSQNQEPRAPQILNMPSWDTLPPALSTVRSYRTVPSCVCSLRSRNKPIGNVVL